MRKRMVGEKAMAVLARNAWLGAELPLFLPVTINDQVATWAARSTPSDPVLALGEEGKLALKASQSRMVLKSPVEAILAIENLLFLRSIVAPASRLSNARAWVKWSTRFRTHEWKSVMQAFEAQRLRCEVEEVWDLSQDFSEVKDLLRRNDLPQVPLKQDAQAPRPSAPSKRKLQPHAFAELLKHCEPSSLCAKFQIGDCSESGDHGTPDHLRKHACWKCKSTEHGGALCSVSSSSSSASSSAGKKKAKHS
jgi:hypothetical protein